MTENMKKFLELLSKDAELSAKASAVNQDALLDIAKGLGIELTAEDFSSQNAELSDDELDTVAGGTICVCVVGGGGKAKGIDNVCACVAYGAGTYDGWSYSHDSNGVWTRCSCPAAGYGDDGVPAK